ncbi:MAG: hypothetical protein AB7S96_05385 [Candidatus Izemoplasmatales bacterium]
MSKFKSNEEFFDFSKLLLVIPIEDLINLMVKYEVKLPLYVHRFLLKETIRQDVFDEKLYPTYTDELKFRLRGYDNFSIFLLEKMIQTYNLDFSLSRYKEMMLNLLYVNKEALVIRNKFFDELEQLKHNYTVDLEVMKYEEFYNVANRIYYEQPGFLDGININDWDEDLLTSYTLGDLKALGAKYGVKIPRRINKTKLVEILTAKFKLSPDESELLEMKSVLELEIYAKEKGFKISIDLKKTDMIEFMKFSLGMYNEYPKDDFFDYHIPVFSDAEAVEEDIVEEEIEEIIIPEEVHDEVEEVIIPLHKEEKVFEEVKEEVKGEVKEEVKQEVKEEIKEEVKEEVIEEPFEETPDIEIPEDLEEEPSLADSTILSPEEKELLDEKINLIIKKYYKRRRTRRVIWTIVLILVVAGLGWAFYTYILPLL